MATRPHERYMLLPEIWAAAGMGWDGYLCIGCCERRLGRRLTRADFQLGELDYSPAGPRLAARLL